MNCRSLPRLLKKAAWSPVVVICLALIVSPVLGAEGRTDARNGGSNNGNSNGHGHNGKGKGKNRKFVLPLERQVNDRVNAGSIVLPEDFTGEEMDIVKSHDDGKHYDSLSPQDKLAVAERTLRNKVIGQEELIDVFLDIERSILIHGLGGRDVPEIVYTLGMPGTGKDTAAKAYIDMRTGEEGHTDHMFYLPVARSPADLWKAFGSNTGYVGSDNLSPLVRWLVAHSGGRYEIVEKGGPHVVEVSNWYPVRKPPEGVKRPEDAILYVDEFHNWSQESKDGFLKQGLEKGYWPINNPGKGVSQIYVPVTIVIASNEGIELVATRDSKGNRVGKPMSYEELHRRWQRARLDKEKLKKAIKQHGAFKDLTQHTNTGISEELLNRIPDSHVVLMEPLSPQQLEKIADIKMEDYAIKMEIAEGDFGPVNITWKAELLEFIVQYQHNAEAGGRAVADKIETLIKKTIRDIIFSRTDLKKGNREQKMDVGIKANPDHTYSLTFHLAIGGKLVASDERLIEHTLYNKPPSPMAAEDLARLNQLPDEINRRVFNLEHVAERLGRALMVGQERAHAEAQKTGGGAPARTFMFLGLSSTGKTETAKVAVDVIGKITGVEGEALKTFDFSQIQSEEQLRDLILGSKDPMTGKVKQSPFVQHYEKFDGKAFFVFDEVANTPRQVLRVLYDILREPTVTTFADGEARSMANVTIFMTGNAGEEWFLQIPRNISKGELRRAMTQVYIQAMSDPGYRRTFLEQFFSPALLNRIGMQNVFFFPPHTFKSTRQLALLKLGQTLVDLKATESGWGWDVEFLTEEDYLNLVRVIETDGFDVNEQGASIDRFAKQEFGEALRAQLLSHQVSAGEQVVLTFAGREPQTEGKPPRNHFTCFVPGEQRSFEFWLDGVEENQSLKSNVTEDILTAYHEAGHSLVQQVLLGDKTEPIRISIVPGVAKIAGQWIRYLGIAKNDVTEYIPPTREATLQHMAVLLAGEQAEYLASGTYSGGKANDIERATSTAYRAILKMGLSEAWGNESPAPDESLAEYKAGLSNDRRKLLEREMQKLMNEARALARDTLVTNFKEGLEPLAVLLAEQGDLDQDALRKFYDERQLQHPDTVGLLRRSWYRMQDFIWRATIGRARRNQRRAILPHVATPNVVANIEDLITKIRQDEVASVELPEERPIAQEDVAQTIQVDEAQWQDHQRRMEEVQKKVEQQKRRHVSSSNASACNGSFIAP